MAGGLGQVAEGAAVETQIGAGDLLQRFEQIGASGRGEVVGGAEALAQHAGDVLVGQAVARQEGARTRF